MTLKEYLREVKKEKVYEVYRKVVLKVKDYSKVTKNNMYEEIIKTYIDDPELILKMITPEETYILKQLLIENLESDCSYIAFVAFGHLKANFLILEENNEYYIPQDMINCIKMAINLNDEKVYSIKDITDSVIIGLVRIYNYLSVNDMLNILLDYHLLFKINDLKTYINKDIRLKDLVTVKRYHNVYYVVSLENFFYKDLILLNENKYRRKIYQLEEVISIGKYKLNLFDNHITSFVNYLEKHLKQEYIPEVIDNLVLYVGANLDSLDTLNKMSYDNGELFKELSKVMNRIPIWIYNGNSLNSLDESTNK